MTPMLRRLAAAIAALCAFSLAGCGFQPLYAESTGAAMAMSRVSVETEDGRPNYLVGLALRDRLGVWAGDEASYILKTRVDLSRDNQSITLDRVARRILIVANVAYGLYDIESGDLLTDGIVTGISTYDVPDEPFGAIQASQDSEQRAAEAAADRLAIALAQYFNENS